VVEIVGRKIGHVRHAARFRKNCGSAVSAGAP
jgi:hypothetical protein